MTDRERIVEAMARAQYEDFMNPPEVHSSPPWDDLDNDLKQQWLHSAEVGTDAALAVMMEPSVEMEQAGFDAEATANPYKTQPHHVVPAVWRAMLATLTPAHPTPPRAGCA